MVNILLFRLPHLANDKPISLKIISQMQLLLNIVAMYFLKYRAQGASAPPFTPYFSYINTHIPQNIPLKA